MSIQVACPVCGATFRLPDNFRGKKNRCKKCDDVFLVNDSEQSQVTGRVMPSGEAQPGAPRVVRRGDDDRAGPRRKKRAARKSGPSMSLIIGGAALGVLLLAGIAIGVIVVVKKLGTKPDVPGASSQDWKEFTSTDGRFSVLLPGSPTKTASGTVQTSAGKLDLHGYMVGPGLGSGERSFVLGYSDLPADARLEADKLLEEIREQALGSFQDFKVVRNEKISIQGFAGIVLRLEGNGRQGPLILEKRVYLVNRRLYQLGAGGPKENAKRTDEDIEKFMNSFKPTGT